MPFFGHHQHRETVSLHSAIDKMPVKYPLCPHDADWAGDIPIRLSPPERQSMRLLSALVRSHSYTDAVDRAGAAPARRVHTQIKKIFQLCTGMTVAKHPDAYAVLQDDPAKLKAHEGRLRALVECLRRYKILNPDKLRTDYVKFVFLLQDSQQPAVREGLGDLELVARLKTVRGFCEKKNLLGLLTEEALPLCITPVPRIANRDALNRALRYKNAVVRAVVQKYIGHASESDIELAMFSIADMHTFTVEHTQPVRAMISLIKKNFSPSQIEKPDLDLGIIANDAESRLTHSHEQQFFFVVQTLTLWANLLEKFHAIWAITEAEMLDPSNEYVLENSGQGVQRIQKNCRRTFEAVQEVLSETIAEIEGETYTRADGTRQAGRWIGSKKIHIGDAQVPNGMFFLDKYTNISRILSPILRVFDRVRQDDEFTRFFVSCAYGSAGALIKAILADFMRHGFDGSGGDTWEDAGSCIDGRLTSTWNWCNSIAKKPFYPAFRLAGFQGFDGDLDA